MLTLMENITQHCFPAFKLPASTKIVYE